MSSELVVNFIDFEKAFYSIDRAILWEIMRNNEILEKLVTLTRKMYEGPVCKVFHEGQLRESFEVKTGVRRGSLLSPFLFILAVP